MLRTSMMSFAAAAAKHRKAPKLNAKPSWLESTKEITPSGIPSKTLQMATYCTGISSIQEGKLKEATQKSFEVISDLVEDYGVLPIPVMNHKNALFRGRFLPNKTSPFEAEEREGGINHNPGLEGIQGGMLCYTQEPESAIYFARGRTKVAKAEKKRGKAIIEISFPSIIQSPNSFWFTASSHHKEYVSPYVANNEKWLAITINENDCIESVEENPKFEGEVPKHWQEFYRELDGAINRVSEVSQAALYQQETLQELRIIFTDDEAGKAAKRIHQAAKKIRENMASPEYSMIKVPSPIRNKMIKTKNSLAKLLSKANKTYNEYKECEKEYKKAYDNYENFEKKPSRSLLENIDERRANLYAEKIGATTQLDSARGAAIRAKNNYRQAEKDYLNLYIDLRKYLKNLDFSELNHKEEEAKALTERFYFFQSKENPGFLEVAKKFNLDPYDYTHRGITLSDVVSEGRVKSGNKKRHITVDDIIDECGGWMEILKKEAKIELQKVLHNERIPA